MRIALTTRITQASGYVETRDSVAHDWTRLLDGWGAMPIFIPNGLRQPADYLKNSAADLLVLTGGDDPAAADDRQRTELALLKYALDASLPVLGVCRGLQSINLFYGGKLSSVSGHVGCQHTVGITNDVWASIYGKRIEVNSFHDVGVRTEDIGEGLAVTGKSEDGFVEALMMTECFVAAVMWHPERNGAPTEDRRLFDAVGSKSFWQT